MGFLSRSEPHWKLLALLFPLYCAALGLLPLTANGDPTVSKVDLVEKRMHTVYDRIFFMWTSVMMI